MMNREVIRTMGYYDDIDRTQKKTSTKTWLLSVIIASMVGSGTTMVAMPYVTKSYAELGQTTPTGNNEQNIVPTQATAINTINTDIVQAVNGVRPAVVTVVNMKSGQGYFNNRGSAPTGTGSGVIIDKEGHIVTNYHVVEGASEIEVIINSKNVKATVSGTDEFTDIAELKDSQEAIKDIKPVKLGISENLQIGEPAIAIGNPLGEFDQTVTVGVISAKQRNLPIQDEAGNTIYEQTVLQTDAAINPGNSGGALINIEGNLIGINSAKIASSGIEGLGFAIPIDEAIPIIDQLINNGKVVRPALGVSISYEVKNIPLQYRGDLPIDYGVIIESVSGAAEQAGLVSGDVVAEIDGVKIDTFIDMRKILFSKKPGDYVKITFYRGTVKKSTEITLQKLSN